MPIKDSLIAATALTHGLRVATRNRRDFENCRIELGGPVCLKDKGVRHKRRPYPAYATLKPLPHCYNQIHGVRSHNAHVKVRPNNQTEVFVHSAT